MPQTAEISPKTRKNSYQGPFADQPNIPRDVFEQRFTRILGPQWPRIFSVACGFSLGAIHQWRRGKTTIPGWSVALLEALEEVQGAFEPLPPRWQVNVRSRGGSRRRTARL